MVEYAVAIGVTRVRFPADAVFAVVFGKHSIKVTLCNWKTLTTRSTGDPEKPHIHSEKATHALFCGEEYFELHRYIYVRVSIVVSISACHADDPGSIPGRGI